MNLHEAVRKDDLVAVQSLLDSGANVNATDDVGMSALNFAAGRGNLAVAQVLLNAGSEVDPVAINGFTPLLGSATYGHAEMAKMLIDHGASLEAREFNGEETALHLAARKGHAKVVRILIEAGADVNAKDNMNATPLFGARHYGHHETAELIRRSGGIESRPPRSGCGGAVVAMLISFTLLMLLTWVLAASHL